jgi:hypothetical protein
VAAEDYRGSQATLEQAKRQVGATARAVTEVTGGVLVDRLRDEISDRSAQAAAELTAFAQAMRAGSGSLRDQGHDTQASVVEDAARRGRSTRGSSLACGFGDADGRREEVVSKRGCVHPRGAAAGSGSRLRSWFAYHSVAARCADRLVRRNRCHRHALS